VGCVVREVSRSAIHRNGLVTSHAFIRAASQKKLHEESKARAPEQANGGRSRYCERSTRGSVIRRNVPFRMRKYVAQHLHKPATPQRRLNPAPHASLLDCPGGPSSSALDFERWTVPPHRRQQQQSAHSALLTRWRANKRRSRVRGASSGGVSAPQGTGDVCGVKLKQPEQEHVLGG
jgi:hypothetical protein